MLSWVVSDIRACSVVVAVAIKESINIQISILAHQYVNLYYYYFLIENGFLPCGSGTIRH
jgi:hypothetical protein